MADGESRRIYFKEHTGLRFFAAYAVVFAHCFPASDGMRLGLMEHIGGTAVSLFFVLSGFVLAISNRNESGDFTKGPRSYVVARFARIYPQYILAFLIAAPSTILRIFYEHPAPSAALPRIGIEAISYLSMLQSWVPWTSSAWNGPAWSLSVEMFFYASFLILPLPSRRSLWWWFLAGAAIMIIPALCFQAKIGRGVFGDGPVLAMFWTRWPPFRLGEFMLGIGVAQSFRYSIFPQTLRPFGTWIALIALVSLGLSLMASNPIITLAGMILIPLALLALAYGNHSVPARLLASNALQRLGEASYGLYLLHRPLQPVYLFLTGRNPLANFSTPLDFLIFSGFAVSVSLATHRFVEIPAAAFIKRKNPGRWISGTFVSPSIRAQPPAASEV